jgi:hypothetical protein
MAYEDIYVTLAEYLGITAGAALVLVMVISIWTLIWKGLALWKASKKNSVPWFIILLVVNTLGILEILYIYVFSKIKLKGKKLKMSKEKKKKK